MIYLDNAATTFPKPEVVYRAMDKTNREDAVNAGRGAYKKARVASALISDTKGLLRKLVKADSFVPVVFNSSVTVALNQIINGYSWRNNAVIYVSPYEHNAVARTVYQLSKQVGATIVELPINEKTLEIDIEEVRYAFSKRHPDAVFCTHVSNVTGYILPIGEIFALAKEYDCLTVLDTAQSLGLLEIDSRNLKADIIAFAGHKTLYGPLGVGGFINVSGVKLKEFIVGGTGSDSLNLEMPQNPEGKYEASSSNVVAISGLNAALQVLDVTDLYNKERNITQYLVNRLGSVDGIKLYLPLDENKHTSIVSFSVDDFKSDEIGEILDEDFDIAVRTGYHCAPFIHKYLKDEKCLGTVRIGVGQFTTKQDIDALIDALNEVLE